jgi:RNA polymerase sigma-70 factor (ECF subfamily)
MTCGYDERTQHVDIAPAAERDRRLVESLLLAEPAAVEELVASYGSRALRLAIGITRNHADAEEIVQDALWAVVRKIDTFTGGSAFSSWLYRIVANVAYDRLRGRRGRLGDCSLDELSARFDKHGERVAHWTNQVHDPAFETDLRLVLTAAIAALSEKHHTIVVLRDVEGLSTQEIAQITGLSVANVKVRTHRARRELRRRLEAFMSGPLAVAARAGVIPTDAYRSDALQPTARRAAGNQTSPQSVLKVSGEGERRRATHRREETARSVRDADV